MLERIKNYFFYGDATKEEFESIKEKIQNSNRITTLVFGSGGAVLTSVMFGLSFANSGLISSRPVYALGAVFSLLLVFMALLSKKLPALTYVTAYAAVSAFLLYGIAIATITRPEEMTVTFMVMLIFVPLVFVDRPINMALVIVAYVILFIVLACQTKTDSVLATDVTDAVIFGILSIFAESVAYRAKIRGYVLEKKLQIMSETDQLTGLNNRNCYEQRILEYPTLYKSSICCVYIDVNGLHELNNAKGHKAGDEMLQFIADCVKEQFGSHDTYRIGGDEYVAFSLDVPEAEIGKRIADLDGQITAQGYNAAIGYEFYDAEAGETAGVASIDSLIRQAETKMYSAKAAYYKVHNRRGRSAYLSPAQAI